MTRWNWMAIKMYSPALCCLFGSLLAMWAISKLGRSQHLSQLAESLHWAPYGLLGLAALLGIVATVRLRHWGPGEAPVCTCGGLLGREREGRFGPYRMCLACGRNHASK